MLSREVGARYQSYGMIKEQLSSDLPVEMTAGATRV